MQTGWTNCPKPIRVQVVGLCAALRETLADNLIGVYLHGSLAMGCFNPQHSDLDLLVIISQPMGLKTKYMLAERLLDFSDQPRPIEITFALIGALHSGVFPIAYDFHFSEDWRDTIREQMTDGSWQHWNDAQRHDPDLAGQIAVTARRGVCLYGQPISQILPSVPHSVLVDCFVEDCEWAFERMTENPVYGILNPCRTYAFVTEGCLLSKEEAGTWALQRLPEQHHRVITQALGRYRGKTAKSHFEPVALEQFAEYIRSQIAGTA